ncbi:hypothetical protein PHJA_002484000 [Phtheirospermum japonicum]|uniref:Uncharacterized protein n=1 Tax=Phtheirospermum japonicum TaxID=374723 RepID=A0A830DAN0_9LAMI|nr:hypothetical protein PHJA_002484000 [Phtheirospermum japonicum]
MSTKIPIFSITQPQHFTDYGFEPQIDYYQVLEEARKHKRESTSRSMDLHFKLQKPISKDDSSKKIKKNKKRWWRNPLLFFKFPKWAPPAADLGGRHHRIGSISGPVYITESRSGSSTPYRTASRPGSGPLTKGEVGIPYISLRELNMDQSHRISATLGEGELVEFVVECWDDGRAKAANVTGPNDESVKGGRGGGDGGSYGDGGGGSNGASRGSGGGGGRCGGGGAPTSYAPSTVTSPPPSASSTASAVSGIAPFGQWVLLGVLYSMIPYDFLRIGRRNTINVFEFCAFALSFILYLVVLHLRRRRCRNCGELAIQD